MECNPAPVLVVSGMAFEARIARGEGIETVHGLNVPVLVRAIEDAIHQGAAGIVSFGVAAGLAPALAAGSVVIAGEVRWQQQTFAADAAWVKALEQLLPDAQNAVVAGVDEALTTPGQKSKLHVVTGASVADMESHHVARLAQQYRLPFAVVRVVLDDAHCALPPAALAATAPDGTIRYGRLIGSLCANPWQIPQLLRLGSAHAKAKKALHRCGDLLKGSRFGLVDLR